MRLNASRPRPKVERPRPVGLPGPDCGAVWPALFAARSTWLTKLLVLPARVLRMRPGRTRKSSPVPLIGVSPGRRKARTVPKFALKSLAFCLGAARDPTERHGERQALIKGLDDDRRAAFILPSSGRVALTPPLSIVKPTMQLASAAKNAPCAHRVGSRAETCTKRLSERGTRAVTSTMRRSLRRTVRPHGRRRIDRQLGALLVLSRKERRLRSRNARPKRRCIASSACPFADQRSDRGDIGPRFGRKRSAGRQMVLVATVDRHCRRQEIRAIHSGRAALGETPRPPEYCRADRRDWRRGRVEREGSPMSPA